jgi:hypothetical protein
MMRSTISRPVLVTSAMLVRRRLPRWTGHTPRSNEPARPAFTGWPTISTGPSAPSTATWPNRSSSKGAEGPAERHRSMEFVYHVEATVTAIMRQRGIRHATLYINKRPCEGDESCYENLEATLPVGHRRPATPGARR